jgi:small-conductance mechanosensitive channel
MDELLSKAENYYLFVVNWLGENLFNYDSLTQLAIILIIMCLSYATAYFLNRFAEKLFGETKFYLKAKRFFKILYWPIISWIMIFSAWQIAQSQQIPIILLRMASSFVSVWIVITLVTNMIKSDGIAKLIRVSAWSLAILNICGLLVPLIDFLRITTFSFGGSTVSMLNIVTGLINLVVLIWGSFFLSGIIDNKLRTSPNVTPSAHVLLSKLSRIVLIVVAFLFGISTMGIDLTALAVFGGAIGVGLGFGLQKVVSNFISGVILLLDKSIKPGDVIEVSGTYGRINKLAGRYTSVISRDGREHLVPNEDIITQPVVNWTFSNSNVRRNLPVNISYNSDLNLAMTQMLEAATDCSRVLSDPEPKVLIKGFGDNGIDLEMRMWIRDSENGVSNIASDVYLNIWNKFNEHGIEFPYPQRDIHIVSAKGLENKKEIS